MTKLLICDDEPGLRTVLKRYAEFEGHEVVEAANGKEAVAACKKGGFDIVIMDIMMPVMDGFLAVQEIRKFSNVPILMLSAKGEEYDKILGFELGIDDYVVKPFSSKEIMMRINAILKRVKGTPKVEEGHLIYTQGGFTADMTAYKVYVDGKEVAMARKLYELLFFMIRNKGIAIPRDRILGEVWGYNYFGDDRTLYTHMKVLRQAIEPYGKLITTLRAFGYRFEG